MEWIAYSLVKEVHLDAADSAFFMKEVAHWHGWDMTEVSSEEYGRVLFQVLAVSQCGTAQTALHTVCTNLLPIPGQLIQCRTEQNIYCLLGGITALVTAGRVQTNDGTLLQPLLVY